MHRPRRRTVAGLVTAGTAAVLIMGSSGEVSMLSTEERHQVVAKTMPMKKGAMEHWYGCTGPTTESTIEYVNQAAAEGADVTQRTGVELRQHGAGLGRPVILQ